MMVAILAALTASGIAIRPSVRMDAYRFDARSCRLIGNLDCPRYANRAMVQLGEPAPQTLSRSLGLR